MLAAPATAASLCCTVKQAKHMVWAALCTVPCACVLAEKSRTAARLLQRRPLLQRVSFRPTIIRVEAGVQRCIQGAAAHVRC